MRLTTNIALAFMITSYSQAKEIIVDKSDQQLYVMDQGAVVMQYDISTGAASGNKTQPHDNKTPEGTFILGDAEDSSTRMLHGEYCYGPYFFRLQGTGWSGIGLHGTTKPVGTPRSTGCIRMRIDDILEFKEQHYVLNMPITIRP